MPAPFALLRFFLPRRRPIGQSIEAADKPAFVITHEMFAAGIACLARYGVMDDGLIAQEVFGAMYDASERA